MYCAGYGVAKLLTRAGGVTFGDVVEELDKLCATRLYWGGWSGDSYTLVHSEALVSNARVVMDAREARARAQASAGHPILQRRVLQALVELHEVEDNDPELEAAVLERWDVLAGANGLQPTPTRQ